MGFPVSERGHAQPNACIDMNRNDEAPCPFTQVNQQKCPAGKPTESVTATRPCEVNVILSSFGTQTTPLPEDE